MPSFMLRCLLNCSIRPSSYGTVFRFLYRLRHACIGERLIVSGFQSAKSKHIRCRIAAFSFCKGFLHVSVLVITSRELWAYLSHRWSISIYKKNPTKRGSSRSLMECREPGSAACIVARGIRQLKILRQARYLSGTYGTTYVINRRGFVGLNISLLKSKSVSFSLY